MAKRNKLSKINNNTNQELHNPQQQPPQPPPPICITFTQDIITQTPQYIQLLNENTQLRKEMSDLKDIHIKELTEKNKNIDELIKENNELKNEIKKLKAQLLCLESNITYLMQENKKTKIHNKINKFIIAIQDINKFFSLEKEIKNNKIKHFLIDIRNNRNNNSHFILDTLSKEITQYKIHTFINKLKNETNDIITNEVKQNIDENYPQLINTFIHFFESKNIKIPDNIPEYIKNQTETWFDMF